MNHQLLHQRSMLIKTVESTESSLMDYIHARRGDNKYLSDKQRSTKEYQLLHKNFSKAYKELQSFNKQHKVMFKSKRKRSNKTVGT